MAASLPAEPHIALLQCPVVYLGRAAPANVPDGLEAVQKPLLELYHPASMQDAIDAMLTVYTSGVQAQSPNGSDKWWPIQDLMECGAFKPAADGPLPFVPLMSGESARRASGQTPTLFAMTFRRRDIPAANTWVFIVESDGSALSLVQALSAAHENTAGWSSPTDRPPIAAPAVESANATQVHCHSKHQASGGNAVFHANGSTRNDDWHCNGGGPIRGGLPGDRRDARDLYEKPPLHGFFYSPNSSLIQKYCVLDRVPTQQIQQQQQQPPQPPQPPQPSQPPQYNQLQQAAVPIMSPFPIYDPFTSRTQDVTGGAGEQDVKGRGHKKHRKKKHHKKARGFSDDSSDDDDDVVEMYTNGNGQKVVIVPDEAVVVRPGRRLLQQEPAGQPYFPPDAGLAWVDPRGNPWADGPDMIPEGHIVPSGVTHYESRILPGPGQPIQPADAFDPFVDEGPYERRLPNGGFVSDAGQLPGGFMFQDPAEMYSSNFILRPSDGFRMPA